MARQRDVVKAAIRAHSSSGTGSWDKAAQQVGLTPEQLSRWQRGSEWAELCREVGEEDLACALPVAVRRLVETARTDKTASGVAAAKTLAGICFGRYANDAAREGAESEPIDFGTLTDQEREIACRLVAMFTRRSVG